MEDLISRQAAIDALKSAKGKDPFGRYDLQNIGLDWGVSAIEKLPSIQPKRGRWEEKGVYDGKAIAEWQSAKCSACGKYHTTPYMYYFSEYNYCPNCGAEMSRRSEE